MLILIGIVLVSHGSLAKSLIETLEILLGKQQNISWLSVGKEEEFDRMRSRLSKGITEANQGQGVIILTDMFGGSASNAALSLIDEEKVEVIAGVNLPMLIRIIELRESHPLLEVAQSAYDAGRNYIQIASNLLTKNT